jgi:hypothetical protein
MTGEVKPQADKFADLARKLESDEDEAAFDAKLREVAKHKPVPDKPK